MEKCQQCKALFIPYCITGNISIQTTELNTELTLIIEQLAHGSIKKLTKTTNGAGLFTFAESELPEGFLNLFDGYLVRLQRNDGTFVEFIEGAETFDCALLETLYQIDPVDNVTIND